LGGAGVARGYLGRPDLTAERFIPDPLSGEAGGRLYRTGDVARRLAGGELDFLGRGDGQVKVRGFRVELGEVEAALLRHESVREATVVARDGGGEDKRLVGYVVPANAGDFSLTALQNYLREKLPAFMIPTAWVVLEALPLTPNGKIDRRALPEPTSAASGEEYVAPRTALEELVVGVWAEVLGVERVGVGDNFFDLGGHSLLAAQVVARLRRACAVDLPLRSIFETPTPAQLADALAGLLRSESGVQAPPVERVERVGPLPLSFGQERLWFLEQLEPDSLAYNMSAAARLEGPLDVGALERSLNEIVRRHEVLRTSFVSNDDRPQQICESELTLRLNVEHVLGRDEQERQEAVQRIAGEEARHRFDLTKAPLLKVRLLRLGARTHVLLLTTHHIVWDGWSTAIFVRELAALYEAFSVGGPSPLAELPVQYADYAVWQRGWLRGERLREQVEYWRGRLAGAPPVLELPTDRPRPAVQTFRGGRHAVEVPEELSARLRQLGRDEGATLFMTLLAGFAAFLHRYTGEEAVVVGTPVANRSRVEFENLIGFFVNTLPLRVDVDGGLSFRELLAGVRSAALTAYAHQDVPFEQLVAELQPERSLGHAPLFQVMLTLENEPAEAASFGGLKLSRQQSSTGTAKFDLAFFVKETARGLEGELEFNADLFDSVTGARMAGHLLKLLASAAADPGQKVSDLPLVEEEEERVLLAESKGEETDWPRTATIHSLFEAQAAETPSALAVVADDEQLSYAELDRRATRLAHRLRALGVGPEVRVGLCLGHTPRLVEAILGVLKAGGAYVPLDPEYPRERLAFMLKDSEAPVVLTESSLAAGLPESGALQLCLDADAGEEGGELAPLPPVAPSSLAYVIYTSGSTGRPKGVQIEHAALVNYVWWARGAYLRGERLDFALYSSIAFDLTVTSVYVPLVSGACVHVYRKAGGHSALEAALEGDRAEALKLTPSHLALLAARDNRGSRLRRLVVGGEALTTELARAVQRSFGREVEIYNEYGPTEATVGCMIHRFGAGADDRVHVPIGRPAANARVYVLDERLRPVPVGVAGELYLGGAGVARGYLGRPDLTAERFIPDPLSGEA
ncbi:MAG: amino acid adenylation domain-containing protein, partial [Acidobacteria bacterium]|nr:amino acid adenylation domain-containing protein [Acidobacteriota bacterium]